MRARALPLFLLTIVSTAAIAAPATAFRVTVPANVVYYQPFDATVEAIDGTGAVDTSYTGTVRVYWTDEVGPPPPNYTFTAGDAGVHVFSVTPTSSGDNKSVTAYDINDPDITGNDTTNVRFGPDATQRFVVSGPSTGNLGEPFNFTIVATDSYFNPTGDYTGTIEIEAYGVNVPSSATFTAADGGSKTLSGTPTRGGAVNIVLRDATYIGMVGSHSLEVACPGFTVTASNNGPVCPNVAPALTASTTETGVSFHWTGPSLFSADGQVVSGRSNYEGPYTVQMTHPNGCSATATTTVALNSTRPNVQSVDGDPNFMCDGTARTFTIADADRNGPYTNIDWTLDPSSSGHIVSGQGTPTVTVAGEYRLGDVPFQGIRLYLTATNGAGCEFVNDSSEHVFVYQRPVTTIETPANGCPGATYTAIPHTVPLPSDLAITYQWSIANGTITEFNMPAGDIRYTVSGEGDAVLTLTANSPYCSYTTTRTITAGPSATIGSTSHTICAGEPVQIPVVLTGQAPFTIGWSDGALQTGISSSFTRTVMPSQTTNYSIVSVSDANCSGASGTGSVEVTARDAALIAQQPKDTVVPRGSRATLTVDVEPDATAIQWYRGLPGDRSQPVNGGTSLELLTPPITQNTTFWVEIETSCGTVTSDAATVNVRSRRRAVEHP